MLETIPCALCNSTGSELVYKVKDLTSASNDEFRLARCSECGLVFINPRPAFSDLGAYYNGYFSWNKEKDPVAFEEDLRGKIKKAVFETHYGKDTNFSKKLIYKVISGYYINLLPILPPARVLDVGCGKGKFMQQMRAMGFDVIGTDVNGEVVERLSGFGLNVFKGRLQDLKFTGSTFDLISLQDVIEHVSDPMGALKEAYRILKPGGILFITTPNFDSYDREVLRGLWWYHEAPRHLYSFSRSTISAFLKKAGFKKIEFRTRGSMLGRGVAWQLEVCRKYSPEWSPALERKLIFDLIFGKVKKYLTAKNRNKEYFYNSLIVLAFKE